MYKRQGGTQRTAWVASTDVTTSLYSSYSNYGSGRATMQGGYSDQIEIGANFTTGKAAYYTLPSTLDLSGYQQLSLNIHQYSGTKVAAGNYSLKLCSDTTGDTAVNTFTIPQPGGTSGTTSDPWSPITVDLGTNLGNSIQSIALYVDSDQGAQNIRMCNIIACKAKSSADSLTLRSLVGRNSATVDDQKLWYSIEAIEGDGDIVVVGPTGRTNYSKTSFYYGTHSAWLGDTGGTYTFYKRECFDTSVDNNATTQTTQVQAINTSGNSSAKITISGGWDTSDSMTTRNGLTFYDGICAQEGLGIYSNNRSYLTLENIGCVRYYFNIAFEYNSHLSIKNCFSVAGGYYGLYYRYNDYSEDIEIYATCAGQNYIIVIDSCDFPKPRADGPYIRKLYWCATYRGQYFYNNGFGGTWEFDHIWCAIWTSYAYGASRQNGPLTIDQITIPIGNSGSGHVFRFENSRTTPEAVGITTFNSTGSYYGFMTSLDDSVKINNFNFTALTRYGYTIGGNAGWLYNGSKVKILGGTVDKDFRLEAAKIYTKNLTRNGVFGDTLMSWSYAYNADDDGVSGVYRNRYPYGKLESDTTTRRTASGYSWKATVESSGKKGNGYIWDIAKVAVKANSQVTASVYVYRTGTGTNGGLRILDGQLAGFASTEAYCTGSAYSWEQVTVTGTPTEDGIITIQAEAYYVSSNLHYAYFDDFSITQA